MHLSRDMRQQPFGQNDVNVRNGGKAGKWYRYENNTTVLIFNQFVDELMNFNAQKTCRFGVISSYFTLLSFLLSFFLPRGCYHSNLSHVKMETSLFEYCLSG